MPQTAVKPQAKPVPDPKGAVVRLYNCGKQMIPVQVKPPKGDFYLHEQTVYLRPGKTVKLPKSYLNQAQIRNLQANRQIKVLFDSEAQGQ